MGVRPPLMRAAPWLLNASAALMGVVEKVIPLPEIYTAEYMRVVAGATYIGDNAKARREWGYAPRGLREGLRETLESEA
jgi:dihydroflavonol-4-reductase